MPFLRTVYDYTLGLVWPLVPDVNKDGKVDVLDLIQQAIVLWADFAEKFGQTSIKFGLDLLLKALTTPEIQALLRKLLTDTGVLTSTGANRETRITKLVEESGVALSGDQKGAMVGVVKTLLTLSGARRFSPGHPSLKA